MKKLLSLIILSTALSIIGSNVWANCSLNMKMDSFDNCIVHENYYYDQFQRQQQQRQEQLIYQQLQELNLRNNQYQQRCVRDYFGAVQCY